MEAGKLIELSLGQEPGEFRLNLDGMAITVHLNNQKRQEPAGQTAGQAAASVPPAPAPQAIPASADKAPEDQEEISAELEYYRQVSREIYEGLGKLSKDINLSIQDLSLAEIIQTAMGSPGEGLDQARNQVTDVLMMTEQATMNIMDLVDQIRDDCQTVQSKLLDLKESRPSDDLEGAGSEPVMDSGEQDLWDQILSQAGEMDHLCASAAFPGGEVQPSASVPVFALADILQILLEFCTNEKVKQHLKAVQAKQDAIFRAMETEQAISLLAAGAPVEDGFHQLPVEPLLNLLQSHCDDDRGKDLLAKMASSADKLFPIPALPLEAREVEEEFGDEPGDTQGNPEMATLWEKLHQNLKLLAERRQAGSGGAAAPSGHQMGAAEVQEVLETVDRITHSLSRIVEALAFQDLSGQRLLKILKIIRQLQVQVLTLLVAAGHKLEVKPDSQSQPGQESDLARKELEGLLHSVAPASDEEFIAVPDDQPLDQSAVNDILTSMGF